jgi:TonB-linked SusC/RagA family outer membrane protein
MKFYAVQHRTLNNRIPLKFLLVMKLILVLMISAIVQVSANGYAQSISLSENKTTLEKIFKEIKKQTGYNFLYNTQMLKKTHAVNIDVANGSIGEVLDLCFAGQPVSYTIDKRTIIVQKKIAQPRVIQKLIKITGKVTDEKGESLPGVSVRVLNSPTGTVTNITGLYEITAAEDATLLFTYIGYSNQNIAVNSQTTLNVVLKVDAAASTLNEVVVVGYGTQKRVSITGAVAVISSKELKQAPTANLSNSLAGLLPGLSVVNASGKPGTGSTISIRGKGTFGNSDALIVVDGIVRSFDEIDPNEVESISVLKDASAAAVYGSRSANGVVLVTTKRGHIGKPRFSYNAYVGSQKPTLYPKLMNAYEYAQTNNVARLNNGANPVGNPLFYTDQQLQDFQNGTIGTNWYDASFKKSSMQQQHNVNVDGGSENIKYFFSGGYTNQDGMYNNINYNRYNFRSNVDAKINPMLTISVDIDGRISQNNSPSFTEASIFSHVIREAPIYNTYNPDGTPKNTTGEHPLEEINHSGYIHDNYSSFFGTLGFKHDLPFITKGLSASGKFNYNRDNQFTKEFDLPYTMYDEDANGNITATKVVGKTLTKTEMTESFKQVVSSTIDLSLNYQRSFGKHDISGLFLYEQSEGNANLFSAYRTNFPSNAVDQLFAGGAIDKNNDGSATQTGRLSYVGRINYAYDSRYLFEASFREDGSTIFSPGHRFGFFPAASVGWRISEEKFIKDNPKLSFINNLKFRGSYGILGNDRVNPYQYQDSYYSQSISGVTVPVAIFNNTDIEQAVGYGVYPNPNFTWETAKTTDVGLEGTLYNGKLGFEFDWFYKQTTQILAARSASTPGTFGRLLPSENYAAVDVNGIEVTLSHANHIGKVNFNIKGNIAYATNKGIIYDDAPGSPLYARKTGNSLDYTVGYTSAGLFQSDQEIKSSPFQSTTTAPGDIKYVDKNGDGIIDENDQSIISKNNTNPKLTFGLFLSADWKGFDFSTVFQGAALSNIMLTGTARNMFNNGGNSNSFAYLLDYWSPTNTGAQYPRAWIDANVNNNKDSNFWLRNTSYVRLKSLQFGYTLNHLGKLKIDKLRIYFAGYNLATWSGFKLFDPELSATQGNYYPQQKNYNVGVNLTF